MAEPRWTDFDTFSKDSLTGATVERADDQWIAFDQDGEVVANRLPSREEAKEWIEEDGYEGPVDDSWTAEPSEDENEDLRLRITFALGTLTDIQKQHTAAIQSVLDTLGDALEGKGETVNTEAEDAIVLFCEQCLTNGPNPKCLACLLHPFKPEPELPPMEVAAATRKVDGSR